MWACSRPGLLKAAALSERKKKKQKKENENWLGAYKQTESAIYGTPTLPWRIASLLCSERVPSRLNGKSQDSVNTIGAKGIRRGSQRSSDNAATGATAWLVFAALFYSNRLTHKFGSPDERRRQTDGGSGNSTNRNAGNDTAKVTSVSVAKTTMK